MLAILTGCLFIKNRPSNRGQQYKDGEIYSPSPQYNQPDAVGAPINAGDFAEQVQPDPFAIAAFIRQSKQRL